MSKILILLCSISLFAQTPSEKTVLDEAKRRNINTVEQALEALNKNGISQSQARILARKQGVSFDDFLKNNFTSKSTKVNASTSDPDSSILVSYTDSIPEADKYLDKKIDDSEIDTPTYFGYNIFDHNPFLEKEYLLGNIDDGYLIAPGDVLRIIVFGNNSLELEATVDRNGNINIPDYGVFFAAGNSFKTLKERLQVYLGKFFSGLLNTPQNTFLDVSLTQLTPTKVVVVGQVNAPGPQILTTQANPLAALYTAGGVKTTGSLREVRVYRNNKLLKRIDLYDYVSMGNIVNDIRLTNNDVVFVPPRISTILLEGEVKESGYYELKSNEGLTDLITFSGGLPASAARDRINVLRIDPSNDASDSSDKSFMTLNLKDLAASNSDFELFDGDEVSILPLLDRVSNRVSIQGNVYSPGEYSLTKYSDLKTLIIDAARGVKEDIYLDKVDVKGIVLPTGEKTFATYNLADVLSGTTQVTLNDSDDVMVYSSEKVQGIPYVYISGYGVQKDLYLDEETLNDSQTDNKEDKIDARDLDEKTLNNSQADKEKNEFGIDENKSDEEGDEEGVEEGAFSNPILWRENLSIYDLIFENTAFNTLEFQQNFFNSRVDVKSYDYKSRKYYTRPYNLSDLSVLKKVYLKPFDRVVIYQESVIEQVDKAVSVSGYVNNPGSYELEQNMYVEDAILIAGGFSDLADQTVVYVNKEERNPETEIISIRETITIDMDYLKGQKQAPDNGFVLGPRDIITVRKNIAYEEQQSISVTGEVQYPRTVVASSKQVSLNYLLGEVGGLTNFALLESSYILRDNLTLSVNLSSINRNAPIFQNGDELIISRNFGSVKTEGALENPSIFNWKKGSRAKYYLSNSGGKLSKLGGKAYVVLSNGQTKRIGLFKNPRVFPDSKVVVNYKTEKEKTEGKFLNDVTNVLGTVTGALTTILLLERL